MPRGVRGNTRRRGKKKASRSPSPTPGTSSNCPPTPQVRHDDPDDLPTSSDDYPRACEEFGRRRNFEDEQLTLNHPPPTPGVHIPYLEIARPPTPNYRSRDPDPDRASDVPLPPRDPLYELEALHPPQTTYTRPMFHPPAAPMANYSAQDDDTSSMYCNPDAAPASANLDSPEASPGHQNLSDDDFMEKKRESSRRMGPNLSEPSDSEDEVLLEDEPFNLPPPTPKIRNTRRKRNNSESPERSKLGKSSNSGKSTPVGNKRLAGKTKLIKGPQLSSSESSDEQVDFEPPRTPGFNIQPRNSRKSTRDEQRTGSPFSREANRPLSISPCMNASGAKSSRFSTPTPPRVTPIVSEERTIAPPTPKKGRGRRKSPDLFPAPKTPSIPPRINSPPPTPGKATRSRIKKEKKNSDNENYVLEPNNQLVPYGYKSYIVDNKAALRHVTVPWPPPLLPGTIKSICLRNLMSHSLFKQEFDAQVNFIVGENGSGKSAILTGIVAGLGGKAFDTGRANKAMYLVKHNQPQAKIEIVLNNFESTYYSREIKIIRTLTNKGSSRYHIQDGDKNLRVLSKAELDFILMRLNIQIDNPLAVLHQEMSKNFLKSKDPHDVYNFFNRAFLLSPCEETLQNSSKIVKSTEDCLVEKEMFQIELEKKAQALDADLLKIRGLKKYKERIETHQKELIWAKVKECEQEMLIVKKEYDDALTKEESIRGEHDNLVQTKQNTDDYKMECDERLKVENKELTKKKNELEAVDKEIFIIDKNVGALQANIRAHTGSRDVKEKTLKKYEKDLASQAKAKEKKSAQYQLKIQTEIEQLKTEFSREAITTDDIRNAKDKVQNQYSATVLKHQAAEKAVLDIKLQIGPLKREVNAGNRSNRNQKNRISALKGYGDEMPRLVDRINGLDKRGMWSVKPRGPLGTCFTMKDDSWTDLVEAVLDTYLTSFVVFSKEDRDLLDNLIHECYKKTPSNNARRLPSITIMHPLREKHNIEAGRVRTGIHPTILDVIELTSDDSMVFNWLVDTHKVEKILLFRSYGIACTYMTSNNVPKNISVGYSEDGYYFTYDPYKALAQKPVRRAVKLMKATSIEEIEKRDAELNALKKELADAQAMLERASQLTDEVWKEKDELERQIQDLTAQWVQASAQQDYTFAKIKQKELNLNSNASGAEEITKECVDDLNAELEAIQVEEAKCVKEIGEWTSQSAKQRQIRDKLKAECNDIAKKHEQTKKTKTSVAEQSIRQAEELGRKDAQLKDQVRVRKEVEGRLRIKEKELEKQVKAAKKICPEISGLGSSIEIQAKIDGLTLELEEHKDKINDEEKITKECEITKYYAGKIGSEIRMCKALLFLLRPILKTQMEYFAKRKEDFAANLQESFFNIVRLHQYDGEALVDHEGKRVMMWVSMDKKRAEKARKSMSLTIDAKNKSRWLASCIDFMGLMSGGERSFTTICFLAACWRNMDSPFYVLDEFEVFMDPIYHTWSQRILRDVTQSRPNAQFFVFSPHKFVDFPSNSKIYRLFPPRNDDNEVFI